MMWGKNLWFDLQSFEPKFGVTMTIDWYIGTRPKKGKYQE